MLHAENSCMHTQNGVPRWTSVHEQRHSGPAHGIPTTAGRLSNADAGISHANATGGHDDAADDDANAASGFATRAYCQLCVVINMECPSDNV